MNRKFLLPPLLLLCALAAWSAFKLIPPGKPISIPKELSHILLPKPRELKPFTLAEADGPGFSLDELKGKWSFVFFGYTHCPDICPTTLALLDRVFDLLEVTPQGTTQGIFVSVDPGRDTPERLKQYVSHFNPAFRGITGEPKAIDGVTRQMMAGYLIHPAEDPKDPDNYAVSHTSAIYLVDPEGRLIGTFSSPHRPKSIANDFLGIQKVFK